MSKLKKYKQRCLKYQKRFNFTGEFEPAFMGEHEFSVPCDPDPDSDYHTQCKHCDQKIMVTPGEWMDDYVWDMKAYLEYLDQKANREDEYGCVVVPTMRQGSIDYLPYDQIKPCIGGRCISKPRTHRHTNPSTRSPRTISLESDTTQQRIIENIGEAIHQ